MATRQQNFGYPPLECSSSFNSSSAITTASPFYHLHHTSYYVQSPSRVSSDSTSNIDQEKQSGRPTPYSSAPSSPLYRLYYSAAAPGESITGSVLSKLGPKRVLPQPDSSSHAKKKANYKWTSVDEESVVPPETKTRHLEIRRRWIFWCWLCFTVMMTLMLCAAFIVWIVRRPHAPEVTLQGMEFQRLGIGAGSDATGVPTEVINLESRVDMTFRNPSKYFKMFSSPINLQLSYLGVPIASGRVPEFLTDAKAGRPLRVRVKSVLIPLYGAGPILEALREDQSTVRLTLTGSIDSHVNLVGQFLTRHFTETIHCDIVLNLGNLHVISSDCFPCS